MLLVRDLLQGKDTTVWTIGPDETVGAALARMAERDVGALPVVAGGTLVGIFSERDYARRGVLHGRDENTPVRALMTTSLYSAEPAHTLERCMLLMTHKHVRHLPVLDGAGRLIGMISIGDVLKAIIAQQRAQLQQLELRRPDPGQEAPDA